MGRGGEEIENHLSYHVSVRNLSHVRRVGVTQGVSPSEVTTTPCDCLITSASNPQNFSLGDEKRDDLWEVHLS